MTFFCCCKRRKQPEEVQDRLPIYLMLKENEKTNLQIYEYFLMN